MPYIIGVALVFVSSSVLADVVDPGRSGDAPISRHCDAATTEKEETAFTDMAEPEVDIPLLKDSANPSKLVPEHIGGEPVASNIRLDKKEQPINPKIEGGNILVDPIRTGSFGTRTSEHSLPSVYVNPNPGFVVFHDDNRKDMRVYGVLSVTIRW